jgi:hypothetical protein
MFLAMELLLIVHKTTALSGGAGKFCAIRYYCQYVCSFSLLAQRKRTKRKGTLSLVPPQAGFPAFLDAAGSLQTRCAQTVQTPFSAASPVLGGVTMGGTAPLSGGFMVPPAPLEKILLLNLIWFFSP